MVAKVRTNRVFDGRMYGKSRPNSCTVDVRRSLDFELQLGFNDINCDVRQDVPGKYASDNSRLKLGSNFGLESFSSWHSTFILVVDILVSPIKATT